MVLPTMFAPSCAGLAAKAGAATSGLKPHDARIPAESLRKIPTAGCFNCCSAKEPIFFVALLTEEGNFLVAIDRKKFLFRDTMLKSQSLSVFLISFSTVPWYPPTHGTD